MMAEIRDFLASLAFVAAICLMAVGITLGIEACLGLGGDEPKGPPAPVVITLPEEVNPNEPVLSLDQDNQLEPAERRDSGDPTPQDEGPGIHEDARDEQPFGAPREAAQEVRSSRPTGVGPPLPLGGAQNYSCPTRLVRNRSSRHGQKVSLFVLHYTVSRPGSLDAIRGLFDRSSFGASSTLGLEPSGRCEQWVPYSEKAWTQGAFNSVSESVEIMAMGSEPRSWWLAQPIFSRGILASIVADRLRSNGLPPNFVDPAGCGVQQAGWTDHHHLECGNNHHDVSPNFPYDVLIKQVRDAYGARAGHPCSALAIERVIGRRMSRFKVIVDGKIGSRTRAAIREFQRIKKFPIDGKIGARLDGPELGLEGCTNLL